MPESRPIIVLGAGVIGLTTAIRLLDSPLCTIHHHPIHIIADHMPSDPLDVRYASTLAGAHHLSFADDGDERNRRWDRTTFRVMYDEWEKEGEKTGLMVIKQTEYYVDAGKHLKIYEEHPNFKIEHSTFADHAVSFTSLTMTPRTYLLRLVRLLDGRATIHRHHFSSLTDPFMTALIGPSPPLAVLVCVGLGASTLGGVSDPHIFPTRGQTVKVHAPWLKAGFTRQVGSLRGGEGGERTYIIPRADGDVILGGTREAGDWEAKPREETGRDILRRTLEICPDLCRPSASTFTKEERLKALEGMVVSNLVGFRPSRRGGTRLERGPDLVLKGSVNGNGHGDANGDGDRDQGKTVVVYNYGHGGAGWQSCWGSAEDAVELLVKSVM